MMDLPILEWLSLVVRWLHIVFGAAWIGTSFYFNWLNNHVRAPEKSLDPGVSGELWSVHGGHFYRVLKYSVAPEKLPKTLHWFKYEAYLTWLSGFCLLAIVYYFRPNAFLVDATVMVLPEWAAITIGVATLLVGWLVYHQLCKSPLGRMPTVFAIVGFVGLTAVAFGLTQVFGSRAAYIHVGALIGTMMAWNVFFVIIPNQKIVVNALVNGESPEPHLGEEAAQRSLHNNYLTLPVLFIMVSNHYPMTYGHEANWAILAALSLIGAGVRHYFNLRGKGHRNVWILPVAAIAMVALALVSAPQRVSVDLTQEVTFAEVQGVIQARCVTCHSGEPTSELFASAPGGVMFDEPGQIVARAEQIHTQVVVSRAMPLGNMTQITERERQIIARWYAQGAFGP